jgi:tetratricopeptide (TPR) repeat protein
VSSRPKPRTALASLCILALCVPKASFADEIDTAVKEARALLNQDKPAAALDRLRDFPADDARVALLRGVARYHAGDAVAAIEALGPLRERLPLASLERREAVQVLGLSHYLAGHLAEAVPLLEETRAWAEDSIELNQILGNAYVETQKPDRARECFARLFGVATESAAAHLLAAQMMIRLEQEAMAESELKRALLKDPRLPQAHFLLGQMALFRGRLDEAVALTRQELELNPANGVAWSQLGDAYVRGQKWDEAAAALQKSIWINPYYSAPYILLGRTYMKKGQPATAEGMLRRAIEFDPNNKSAHYLLGQLLQLDGRADEAKRELEIANSLQGKSGR